MLRLERSKEEKDIAIRLRGTESLFTRPFVYALLFSVVLHASFCFTFKIVSPDLREFPPFSPLRVEVDWGAAHQGIESSQIPELQVKGTLPRYVLKPENSSPSSPSLPTSSVQLEEWSKPIQFPQKSFDRLEETAYRPERVHFSFHRSQNPVDVHISGQVSSWTVANDGLEQLNKELGREVYSEPFTNKFRIQVEGQGGTIFWFEQLQGSGEKELDAIAQSILQEMRFQPSSNNWATEGEICITFFVSPSDSYSRLLKNQDIVEADTANHEEQSTTGESL